MPRRESVLTLASEGFSEQSCVTNSSLSIIQNSCRIGRERQSDQHKLVGHSRADLSESGGQTDGSDWKFWFVRTAPHGGTDYLFVKLRQLFELRK